jgi:hypothetical protein
LARNARQQKLREDATRKLLLVYKRGVLGAFRLWASKAGLKTQRDDILFQASIAMLVPLLKRLDDRFVRKPLRTGFNALKADRLPKLQ